MPLVALIGWAETRSLEMKSPKLVVGMQTRGPQPAAYQVHISRKLGLEVEPGQQGASVQDADVITSMLAAVPNACPQSF